MSVRSGAIAPPEQTPATPPDRYADMSQQRAQWSRDDDELLLLDEIEETPDDEHIDDLV